MNPLRYVSIRLFALSAPCLTLLHAATPTELVFTMRGDGRHTGDAVPLGNGNLGALLRGSGRTLTLSLERADVFLPRPAPALASKSFRHETLLRFTRENRPAPGPLGAPHPFLNPYAPDVAPARVPLGKVEFTLPPGTDIAGFTLNPVGAEVRADSARGVEATAFVHASRDLLYLWFPHGVADMRLLPPEDPAVRFAPSLAPGLARKPAAFADLKLPAGTLARDDDRRLFTRPLDDKHVLTVLIRKKDTAHGVLCVIAAAVSRDAKNPAAAVEKLVKDALEDGYDATLDNHRSRRVRLATRSALRLPDPEIHAMDVATKHLFSSSARKGVPPAGARGVWSTDGVRLPENLGAHGVDLVIPRLPALIDGLHDETAGLREFLLGKLPAFKKHAKDFYDVNGAWVPPRFWNDGAPDAFLGEESAVRPLTGDRPGADALSPLPGALALHFLREEWRHTRDDKILAKNTLPFALEIAGACRRLLPLEGPAVIPGADDPASVEALRRIFLITRDLCLGAERPEEAAEWGALASRVPQVPPGALPPAVSDSGLEHLLARPASGELGIRRAVTAYFAALAPDAQGKTADLALAELRRLARPIADTRDPGHRHPNGMLDNTPQRRRPEDTHLLINAYAALAVREMLLASRVPPGGEPNAEVLVIFPNMPVAWANADFTDLSAAGGYTVSAVRKGGRTESFRIDTRRGGPIRIRNNFGGRTPRWSREGVREVDGVFVFEAKAGDSLAARFVE